MLGLLLLLPVLAIAAVSWRALSADLQLAIANAQLNGIAWRVDTLTSIANAARLTPWRAAPHVAASRTLTTVKDLDAALDAAAAAAVRDPSNSFHWLYWARLRGSRDLYDLQTLRAYEQAVALSPTDDSVHWSIATDGILRWRHGDAALRQAWIRSIDFNLERRQRNALLRFVAYYVKEIPLCAAIGKRPSIAQWCTWIKPMRNACLAEGLNQKALQGCTALGFPTLVSRP